MPDTKVLVEVFEERERQDAKWGEQNHPDGTGDGYAAMAGAYHTICDWKHKIGAGAYLDILLEEVFEAAAESDPAKLRTELVQVAAVAVAWVECIDRRTPTITRDGRVVTAEQAAALMTAHLRDPRDDPQPGDVLLQPPRPNFQASPVYVVNRIGDCIFYATATRGITTIWLDTWQASMLNASRVDPKTAWPMPRKSTSPQA